MTAVVIVFWAALGLLVYTQVGYALLLGLLARAPLAAAARDRSGRR
jgi:hypothetical protein